MVEDIQFIDQDQNIQDIMMDRVEVDEERARKMDDLRGLNQFFNMNADIPIFYNEPFIEDNIEMQGEDKLEVNNEVHDALENQGALINEEPPVNEDIRNHAHPHHFPYLGGWLESSDSDSRSSQTNSGWLFIDSSSDVVTPRAYHHIQEKALNNT